jgi:hypothetical protein
MAMDHDHDHDHGHEQEGSTGGMLAGPRRTSALYWPVTPSMSLDGLESTGRIRVIALDARIAIDADALEMHDDPADRFIVAPGSGPSPRGQATGADPSAGPRRG